MPALRKSLIEFWNIATHLPQTMLHASRDEEIAFLQREVVPRRGELYNALREVTAADQRMLENSEGEFAGTRRRAAERLLLMLGLGVLLSVLVTRFSLRHAESLEREADRHFAAIEQAKQELQQLSARLLEIEEEGRRRLSRELHDEIGQSLALLQIEISHAQTLLAGSPSGLREAARARASAGRAYSAEHPQYFRSTAPRTARRPRARYPPCSSNWKSFSAAAASPANSSRTVWKTAYPIRFGRACTVWCRKPCTTARSTPARARYESGCANWANFLWQRWRTTACGFASTDKRATGLGLLGMRERTANAGGSLVIDSGPGHEEPASLFAFPWCDRKTRSMPDVTSPPVG